MPVFSVAEVAGIISAAHGWHADAQAKAHRQIKHWRAEGLLTPSARQTDARGTDKFDAAAIYRARFLMVLADIGMDAKDMRTAMWCLDRAGTFQLAQAVDHMVADERLKFTCYVRISRDGAGRKIVAAAVTSNFDPLLTLTDADRDNAEDRDVFDQAEVIVALDRLVGPIAARLRNA